jgi:hypothetical protein
MKEMNRNHKKRREEEEEEEEEINALKETTETKPTNKRQNQSLMTYLGPTSRLSSLPTAIAIRYVYE